MMATLKSIHGMAVKCQQFMLWKLVFVCGGREGRKRGRRVLICAPGSYKARLQALIPPTQSVAPAAPHSEAGPSWHGEQFLPAFPHSESSDSEDSNTGEGGRCVCSAITILSSMKQQWWGLGAMWGVGYLSCT